MPQRRQLLDLKHPFFNPLWRRVATTVFLVVWTLFELSSGSVFWTMLFGALTIYCAYTFFVNWTDAEPR